MMAPLCERLVNKKSNKNKKTIKGLLFIIVDLVLILYII